MILSFCDSPDILKVMKLVRLIIIVIKIIVPIILIVTGMITFVKGVTDQKDGLSSALKVFTKKVITAVVLFLVPSLVALIISAVLTSNEYVNCFNNATSERIQELYVERVEDLIEYAQLNKDRASYAQALKFVDEIEDEEERKGYKQELEDVLEYIKEEEKKEKERNKVNYNYTPIPSDTPVNVSGFDYITAKQPYDADTAAFLEVAKETWLTGVEPRDPAFVWGSSGVIPPRANGTYLDCSSYVSWALYNFGYTDKFSVPNYTWILYGDNYTSMYGWREIKVGATEDISNKVMPGDIVVRYGVHASNGKTEGHTHIIASVTDGNILAYDGGSDESLKHWKYPNGYPTLRGTFLLGSDGRPGKIIRVTRK